MRGREPPAGTRPHSPGAGGAEVVEVAVGARGPLKTVPGPDWGAHDPRVAEPEAGRARAPEGTCSVGCTARVSPVTPCQRPKMSPMEATGRVNRSRPSTDSGREVGAPRPCAPASGTRLPPGSLPLRAPRHGLGSGPSRPALRQFFTETQGPRGASRQRAVQEAAGGGDAGAVSRRAPLRAPRTPSPSSPGRASEQSQSRVFAA